MSDIAPKPIAASSGVLPSMANATPAATNTATAAEIPAAVANLSVGTFITGTVIERNPRGLVTIRTDKGTIKLQTPVPLKTGSTVTLQLQSVGAQVQLSILSIDGQPLVSAAAKPGQMPVRPDATIAKPPVDPAATRAAPTQPGAAAAQTIVGDDGHEATAIRQTSDRSAPERGIAPRATTPQPVAPATSFIARPLAQIGSAGLEALSSQSAAMQPTTAANAATAAGRTPASAAPIITTNTTPSAPGMAPSPTTVQTAGPLPAQPAVAQMNPTSVMVPRTGAAPANPPVTGAPATPAAPPVATPIPTATTITPGSQFTASIMTPATVRAGVIVTQPIIPGPTASPTTQDVPPLSTAAPPAMAPMTAPVTTSAPSPTPSALPSDQVILRLLGMESPQAPSSLANISAAAGDPRVAPGVTVPSGALTTVGTIVEGPDPPQRSATSTQVAGKASAPAQTWIATPFGVVSAPGPAPGPVGTRLLLEVMLRGEAAPTLSTATAAPLPAPLSAADKTWPALRDIMAAVPSVAPDAAEHLVNVTLPRIGPNLAAGMMAFVAAARQGNPRSWLGEQTVDSLLRSSHGHLIDRLGDDFALTARVAAESAPQGWQAMLVPLFDGERLQQLRFYWQRQKRKAEDRKPSTRFVVEAELTKLGMLQLDGIYDKPQFDLVVRTSTSLPGTIRSDIIEIFGDALLATNLKGAVSFQTNASLRAGALAGEEPTADTGIGLIV